MIQLAISVLTFATAGLVSWQTWRQNSKIEQVHVLVNSRLTVVVDRVAQLTQVMQDAGVAIPPTEEKGSDV